jgi:hypothetical protein
LRQLPHRHLQRVTITAITITTTPRNPAPALNKPAHSGSFHLPQMLISQTL